MQLTQHFRSEELQCPCCRQIIFDWRLVHALETLRCLIGHPVIINSGYRCPKHNQVVGGAPGSQHLVGRAADIRVAGMSGLELYRLAARISDFHGFGVASGWIHLDVRHGPLSKWTYDEHGRVQPWPEGFE